MAEKETVTEETSVTEDAVISTETVGTAAEETTAKEDIEAIAEEAVENQGPQAAEQAEPEASTEEDGEEKAEEATVTKDAATSAETAEPAAEETTAKEETEAVAEQVGENQEPQATEQTEIEASTGEDREENAEEATVTEEAVTSAETAESPAEEITAKEDTETATEETAESQETQAAEQAEPEADTEQDSKEKVAVTPQTIESLTIELSTKSLAAFCDDISAMFGVNMKCKQQEACEETVEDIQKRYEKPVAVNCVKSDGTLEGTIEIILNREGLFILAGAIAMPEQMTSLLEKCVGPANIQKNIKSGSLKEAEGARDTLAEAGNLLVGCWDRVFREELQGHGHFAQTNTFIGDPWDNPEEKIGLNPEEDLLLIPYEMTIEPYPPFRCGVIFPQAIIGKAKAEAEERAEAEAKARAEAEEKAGIEAAEKAKAEAEEQGSDADEGAAKEGVEASPDEKDAATDVNANDDTAEEEVASHENEESAVGGISETIQKITQSPAFLPGESAHISLAMSAKDVMQKDIVWISPDESVGQTLKKMQQHDTGYVMIGRQGILEGIVSKSDITGAISPYLRPVFAQWRRPLDDATLNIRVKWIMSRPVRTIKPETSLVTIMENMRQSGGRCLPVVSQEGTVQGLVTIFDIFKILLGSNPNISSMGKTPLAPSLV